MINLSPQSHQSRGMSSEEEVLFACTAYRPSRLKERATRLKARLLIEPVVMLACPYHWI